MKKLWICRDFSSDFLNLYNAEPDKKDAVKEDEGLIYDDGNEKYISDEASLETLLDACGIELGRGQFVGITFDEDVWELTDCVCPECGKAKEY